MTRKAKAFWIGFLTPVIPGCGVVMVGFVMTFAQGDVHAGMVRVLLTLYYGVPSILLGLVIGSVAAACTRNKPGGPKCEKCGYSLVGLTSDKCPECGHELRARVKA